MGQLVDEDHLGRALVPGEVVLAVLDQGVLVDIGAAEYIHKRLVEQRTEQTAILVISEDLDEVFALSDRIAVMYEGKIMAILDPTDATREQIGLLMAGVQPDAV